MLHFTHAAYKNEILEMAIFVIKDSLQSDAQEINQPT